MWPGSAEVEGGENDLWKGESVDGSGVSGLSITIPCLFDALPRPSMSLWFSPNDNDEAMGPAENTLMQLDVLFAINGFIKC